MSYHKDHNSDICTKAFVYNFLTWSFDLFLRLYLSDITREDPVAIAMTALKTGERDVWLGACKLKAPIYSDKSILRYRYVKNSMRMKLENKIFLQKFTVVWHYFSLMYSHNGKVYFKGLPLKDFTCKNHKSLLLFQVIKNWLNKLQNFSINSITVYLTLYILL